MGSDERPARQSSYKVTLLSSRRVKSQPFVAQSASLLQPDVGSCRFIAGPRGCRCLRHLCWSLHTLPRSTSSPTRMTPTHILPMSGLGRAPLRWATRSASTTLSTLNDSFGSFASIPRYPRYVRLLFDSDRTADIPRRQLCANSDIRGPCLCVAHSQGLRRSMAGACGSS